jgi:hypothetical protein
VSAQVDILSRGRRDPPSQVSCSLELRSLVRSLCFLNLTFGTVIFVPNLLYSRTSANGQLLPDHSHFVTMFSSLTSNVRTQSPLILPPPVVVVSTKAVRPMTLTYWLRLRALQSSWCRTTVRACARRSFVLGAGSPIGRSPHQAVRLSTSALRDPSFRTRRYKRRAPIMLVVIARHALIAFRLLKASGGQVCLGVCGQGLVSLWHIENRYECRSLFAKDSPL